MWWGCQKVVKRLSEGIYWTIFVLWWDFYLKVVRQNDYPEVVNIPKGLSQGCHNMTTLWQPFIFIRVTIMIIAGSSYGRQWNKSGIVTNKGCQYDNLLTTLLILWQPFSKGVVTFGTTFDYLVFSVQYLIEPSHPVERITKMSSLICWNRVFLLDVLTVTVIVLACFRCD